MCCRLNPFILSERNASLLRSSIKKKYLESKEKYLIQFRQGDLGIHRDGRTLIKLVSEWLYGAQSPTATDQENLVGIYMCQITEILGFIY